MVCHAALLYMDQGRAQLCKWQKQLDTSGEGPLPQHLHTAPLRLQAQGWQGSAGGPLGPCAAFGGAWVSKSPCCLVGPQPAKSLFLTKIGAGDDKALRVNRVVPPA
jgi:hypothetical protein